MENHSTQSISNPSLVSNLHHLESFTDCFICSLCFPNSQSNVNPYSASLSLLPNGTVTSDPVIFQTHLITCHKLDTSQICLYCNLKIRNSHLVSHMIGHLLIGKTNCTNQDKLFHCPYKSDCPTDFRTDHLSLLKQHLEVQHNPRLEHTICDCPQCHRKFPNLDQWFDHMKTYSKFLVHCTEPGCFVKSPSRVLLLDHVKRQHLSHKLGSSLIKETVEMLCDHTGPNLTSPITQSMTNKPNNHCCSTRIYSEFAPRMVFLLRCPYCNLTTLRWHHFIMHPTSCPGLDCNIKHSKSPDLIYRCHIYWCSDCQAISTERDLVKEHVTYFHDTQAFVCREHLRIALLNSSGGAIRRKLVESPSLTTTTNSTQDLNGSDGVESESLLNLAALARPSASKLVYYSNRAIQPISLVSPTPILAAPSTPIPSAPITTQLTTVNTAGNAVSMPVLNGVAAFKTFQNLTAGGHEVSNLTASEAASAMAAMAAAALSGLTNFNITKPVSTISSGLGTANTTQLTNPSIPILAVTDPTCRTIDKPASVDLTPPSAPSSASYTINTNLLPTMTTGAITMNAIPLPKLSFGPSDCGSSSVVKLGSKDLPAPPQLTSSLPTPSSPAPVEQSKHHPLPQTLSPARQSEESPKQPADGNSHNANEVLVSFPFDEEKFRQELSATLKPPVIDGLAAKMRQFSTYFVRIIGKENHRRIPVCPECEKVFPYGLGDFKRHLLTVHLEIQRQFLKDCLRFTYLPKSEEKFQEFQEQLSMRQMKPRMLEPGRKRVPLPYSIRILRRLVHQFPVATRDYLEKKMQIYSRLSVIVDSRGGFRRFKCNHCSYTSPHGLGDVRKHILGSHCGIATKHFRHCLQASRLDPVEFTLLSDDKLARLARDFVKRRQNSKTQSQRSKSPRSEPVDLRSSRVSEHQTATKNANTTKSQDSYVSHFTAVVPGSKNKVTVRIRPPIPPESCSNISTSNSSSPAMSSVANLNGGINGTAMTTTTSSSTLNRPVISSISPANSHGSAPDFLDLSYVVTIPGMGDADRIIELDLPFSEPVLRHLLANSKAAPKVIEDIVSRMRYYSSYKMARICRGDRTLAFGCPCGRLFITTRQPDRAIRASTLADSRRHVMGVHARVPSVYITVCCQASRITKEYDFKIYPNDVLLRMATDRPIKFTNSISEIVPAPPPASRPLKELAPYPITMATTPASVTNPTITTSTSSGASTPCAQPSNEVDSTSEDIDHLISEDDEDEYYEPNPDLLDNDMADLNEDNDKKEPEGDPLSHLLAAQASSTEEVERVIDLPFSSEALHALVQGFCPEQYFPILEAKMKTYSTLKVYITRHRGRRYFCCSGCPSSSPHGMGDIRKHILGVHAKVPERYKAAAMHCSRLSREDNSLLPDHVLLHLSKMKWRGTVIKPLSEIDMSQYGSRRGVAMGLSRATGQFASQVYQPTTHRESEMRLSISRSELHSSTSKYQPSKSPSPQLDEIPAPPTTVESSSPEPVYYVLRKQINASEDDTTSKLGDSTNYIYACSACRFSSGYVGGLKAHIVRVHLGLPIRKCAYCEATFKTRVDALAHHRAMHNDLEFFADHQPMDYHNAISKITVKDVDGTLGHNSTPSIDLTLEDSFEDDGLDSDLSLRTNCEDLTRPAKIPRLANDKPSPVSNGSPSPQQSKPTSTTTTNNSKDGKTPVLRTALSGSSRRKPSKMQLVQLRPFDGPNSSEVSPPLAATQTSTTGPKSNDLMSSSSSSSNDDADALEFNRLASIPPILGSIKNRVGV